MSGVQGSFFPADPDGDDWRVHLRRDYPDIRQLALEEAYDRLQWHEAHRTPQTSKRDELPRKLAQEWFHLLGEAGLRVLLFRRGYEVDVLNWGDHSPDARQRSREGNVLPGLSVYVPEIEDGDLIVREAEKEQTPDLMFVLIRVKLYGKPKEYVKAYGWRRAEEGWKLGVPYGPRGTPLRAKGDKRVPYLHPMEQLLPHLPAPVR